LSGSHILFSKAGRITAALLGGALLLGGCSGRDAEAAEQLAEMNVVAARAEKAAERAEAALAKIEKAGQPQVVEADPDSTEDAEDAAIAAENEPLSTEPEIKS
jgi:NAD(P)-dependent dehydrogenase (short-subunit alcohol dehydrogenase family)